MSNALSTPEGRIQLLAQTFHCLAKAPGVAHWSADKFDEWAASGGLSHGEKCTARFILAVWNPEHEWESGKFDLMEALRVWGIDHHSAFLEWARDPWWA